MKTENLETKQESIAAIQQHVKEIGNLRKQNPTAALERIHQILMSMSSAEPDIENDEAYFFTKAQAQLLRASILTEMRDFESARDDVAKALTQFQRVNDSDYIGRAINTQATIAMYNSEFSNALLLFTTALDYAEKSGNSELITMVLNNIGATHHGIGEFAKALTFFSKALDIAESNGDLKNLAFGYNVSATSLNRLGRMDEAEEYYRKSFDLYQKLHDTSGLMRAYSDYGVMLNQRELYAEAMKYIRMSLQLSIELDNTYSQAVNYGNLAVVYYNLHDFAASIDFLKKSLTIHEHNNDQLGIASSFSNIAVLYVELGDYDNALEFAQRGMEISERVGFIELNALNHNTYCSIYRGQENYKKALEHIQAAQTLYRKYLGEHSVAICYLQEGDIHLQLGNTFEALKDYRAGLDNALQFKLTSRVFDAQLRIAETLMAVDDKSHEEEIRRLYMDITQYLATANNIDSNEFNKAAKIAEGLTDYKRAYSYMRNAMELHTIATNGNTAKQVLNLKIERELATKEQERLVAENKRELAQRDAEIFRLKNIELEEKKRTIEEQNEELSAKQIQLNASNTKLRQALLDLAHLTASNKARTLLMVILFTLFVLSEVIVDPIVDYLTTSVYIGIVLRFAAGLLIRPIEIYAEEFMTRRKRIAILSALDE